MRAFPTASTSFDTRAGRHGRRRPLRLRNGRRRHRVDLVRRVSSHHGGAVVSSRVGDPRRFAGRHRCGGTRVGAPSGARRLYPARGRDGHAATPPRCRAHLRRRSGLAADVPPHEERTPRIGIPSPRLARLRALPALSPQALSVWTEAVGERGFSSGLVGTLGRDPPLRAARRPRHASPRGRLPRRHPRDPGRPRVRRRAT